MENSSNIQSTRLKELETLEIELLLEGVFQYYGFDFRNYSLASLKRRIWNAVRSENLSTISALQEKILHDPECLERFLLGLSVNITSMFRDPSFYLALRTKVIPQLRTHSFIRVWCAGCSTGEEVYSLAILLEEEQLYHRCRIYATDMNERVLQKAKAGIFPLEFMQEYTQNYLSSGGKQSFSEYYTAAYNHAIFRSSLRENIVFAQHNLANDSSFNEFHIILCRNVLIYFNRILQERVHKLFYESLCKFGILGLGQQESLKGMQCEGCYQEIGKGEKIYQKNR